MVFLTNPFGRENIVTMKPERLFPSNLMEVNTMNDTQKLQIQKLRKEGYGYGKIAEKLGININTVKTYCRRHCLNGVAVESKKESMKKTCLCCGIPVTQIAGRKEKKFCSDKCRNKWWNSNLNQVNRKANYEYICPYCKKPFIAYGNKNRKYCSHACYIADRFGGRQ